MVLEYGKRKSKFIFVTGGVMSGLGKGIITSSIAKLFQLSGFRVSCAKIDPYVNFDAGTMNPIAHGEVFVTDDGGECDMDIGNYERFLDIALTKDHNITTGRIYSEVIQLEREGRYLGQCVQIIPHITDAIKNKLRTITIENNLDVLVIECGGTVGDIESLPFLEAFRQIELEGGSENTLFVHVTLAPVLDVVGEQKTKPTQHSVQELRRIGIHPNILAVRCKTPLTSESRRKISLFASIPETNVISCHDVGSIYKVPEILDDQNLMKTVSKKLLLGRSNPKLAQWKTISRSFINTKKSIKIAIVGKYVSLPDSYVSVYQALSHAGASLGIHVDIDWIESELFENEKISKLESLKQYNGILVPGGFGSRGSEGIINVATYAHKENKPYLGICFGFQLALVSLARNLCNLEEANSTEINPDTRNPVVVFMPEQKTIEKLGGTMRLGAHEIDIIPNTVAERIYQSNAIRKRHRHRYEFNLSYREKLESEKVIFSGFSDNKNRTEILELQDHKFFFGVQYHCEFDSRPGNPEAAFRQFILKSSF